MGAMTDVEWDSPLLEPVVNAEAERFLRRRMGLIPSGAYYFLDSPWFTRTLADLDPRTMPLVHTPRVMVGLLSLVVSQDNSCRYCYATTRSMMKILGYPEERIRRLEADLQTAELGRERTLGLEFARRISRANPLATRSDIQALLNAGLKAEAVVELGALAVLNVFYNRMATLAALPFEQTEKLADSWPVRLLRPLVALRIAIGFRRGRPEALSPQQEVGPFSTLVNAVAPLPIASRLRSVIDDCLASPVLSRRTKALVFAVVARGLGCTIADRESLALLEAEGLGGVAAERALRDLASADLDPLENAMLPLARETLWYRPVTLQRHARALRARMSREQFVELVGVASLANAVCRLGPIVNATGKAASGC